MHLDVLLTVPGLTVHYADEERCVASSGLSILSGTSDVDDWQRLVDLPSSFFDGVLLHSSLCSRLARGGVQSVLPMDHHSDHNWVAVANRRIYLVSTIHHHALEIMKVGGGRRPPRHSVCVTGDSVLVGEYGDNPKREPVNLYRITIPTQQIEVLHQFDQGTVRHIHAIQKDPYSEWLWVTTGDKDSECMIARLNPRNGELKCVGRGSQQWRTLDLGFRPDAVYWGTDNPRGSNKIWRLNRATGTAEAVGDVVGPVYYNACLQDYLVFGTTVEGGEGEQDGWGRLYAVDLKDNIREIWKQRKDRWSPHLFGYGVYEFAEGHLGGNRFWVATRGFEGEKKSYLFSLNDE